MVELTKNMIKWLVLIIIIILLVFVIIKIAGGPNKAHKSTLSKEPQVIDYENGSSNDTTKEKEDESENENSKEANSEEIVEVGDTGTNEVIIELLGMFAIGMASCFVYKNRTKEEA